LACGIARWHSVQPKLITSRSYFSAEPDTAILVRHVGKCFGYQEMAMLS